MRRSFVKLLPLVVLTFVMATFLSVYDAGAAAKYPSRPIQVVVPRSTGGAMDNVARGIQPYFQKNIGVSVAINNVVGAAGIIGTNKVYDSPADGHMLLIGSNSDLVRYRMTGTQTHFGTEFLKGFIPICSILNGDVGALCVNKNSPYKSFADIVAKAKKDGVVVGICPSSSLN